MNQLIQPSSRRTLFLVFAAIGVMHLGYALLAAVPVMHPDEAGYLMNAAALAGYRSDAALPYFAGYSLFLVPAFWTGWDMESVYFLVKIVNTLFFTGSFILLYCLARRLLPEERPGRVLTAVFVTSLYPAFLAYNALALSENAFIFFFILSAVLALRLDSRLIGIWLLYGATVGMLFVVHPKGLPLLGVALVVAGYSAWRERVYGYWLLVAVLILGLVFAGYGLKEHIQGLLSFTTESSVQKSYPTVATKVGHLIDPVGIAHFFGNLSGQVLYLIVGTLGLSVFGFALVLRRLKEAEGGRRLVWGYLALALVATVFMSAASHSQPGRLDHVPLWPLQRRGAGAISGVWPVDCLA